MTRHYQDTDTRRRQIAEAALRTLANSGVEQFTARKIAGIVGISDGTMFRHFRNKVEIVNEAIELLEQQMTESLVDTGSPRQNLEAFFRHRAAFVGEKGSVGRLIFSENLFHLAGEEGRARLAKWRDLNVQYLLRNLSAMNEEGTLRQDTDLPAKALLFQGVLLSFAMQASLGKGGTKDALNARIEHAWRNLQAVLFNN